MAKKLFFVFLIAFFLISCAKERLEVKTTPPNIEPIKEQEENIIKKKESTLEPKASVEDFSGFKSLTPEEVSPDMIAKAQLSISDEMVEKGPLSKMVHFDYDSYELRNDAKETLKEIANYLNEYKSIVLLIEGHCDERGTREYNLALGLRRAESVKKYLSDLGINEERLKTISYGEDKPLDPASNESAWAKNRRAQFKRVQ